MRTRSTWLQALLRSVLVWAALLGSMDASLVGARPEAGGGSPGAHGSSPRPKPPKPKPVRSKKSHGAQPVKAGVSTSPPAAARMAAVLPSSKASGAVGAVVPRRVTRGGGARGPLALPKYTPLKLPDASPLPPPPGTPRGTPPPPPRRARGRAQVGSTRTEARPTESASRRGATTPTLRVARRGGPAGGESIDSAKSSGDVRAGRVAGKPSSPANSQARRGPVSAKTGAKSASFDITTYKPRGRRVRGQPTQGKEIVVEGAPTTIGARLGKGSFGKVYEVRQGNDTLVLKHTSVSALRNDILRRNASAPSNQQVTASPETIIGRQIRNEFLAQQKAHALSPRHFPKPRSHEVNQIVMEKVEGRTLWTVQGRLKRLVDNNAITPEDQTAVIQEVGRQMFTAVARLESAGIVHRDLSYNNIMVDRSGQVKIIDFGTAKSPGVTDQQLRRTMVYGGTPGFTSKNARDAFDGKSSSRSNDDAFSVGRSLMFLAGGQKLVDQAESTPVLPFNLPRLGRNQGAEFFNLMQKTTTGIDASGNLYRGSELRPSQALKMKFLSEPSRVSAQRVSEILSALGDPSI